ncbi:MAG: hypothetical protein SFX73_17185 [Kofleriaceae bacterium]|nr:hypothetical protein [Kofleriaceae bacterium]
MTWIAALGATCGPLVGPAARLADADFPRGTDGIRRLAHEVEKFAAREEASDDEDRAFVESAGALLGLLLVDHVGDGAYAERDGAHRVRLGARGFFDPFDAIDSALDADRPTAWLARAVAFAEKEAADVGPVSRVVAAFEQRLAMTRDDLEVEARFERRVWLTGGIEVDLTRAVDATHDQRPEAVAQAVEKICALLPGAARAPHTTWLEAAPRIVPRVLGPTFAAPGVYEAPLLGPLRLALVLAFEGRARFVRAREAEDWGEDVARGRAIENLAARSSRARFARVEHSGGAWVVARTGDGLDAARLVLPGLHDVLAAELGTPVVVAVPHRDALLACAAAGGVSVTALRDRAEDDARRAPHRISESLFLLSASGLALLR